MLKSNKRMPRRSHSGKGCPIWSSLSSDSLHEQPEDKSEVPNHLATINQRVRYSFKEESRVIISSGRVGSGLETLPDRATLVFISGIEQTLL